MLDNTEKGKPDDWPSGFFFPVLGGRTPLFLTEEPGKVEGVVISYGAGDIADRELRFF